MDCDLGEELELFKRTVRDFVNREIAPVAQEWDEKGEYPMHLYQRMKESLRLLAQFYHYHQAQCRAARLQVVFHQAFGQPTHDILFHDRIEDG